MGTKREFGSLSPLENIAACKSMCFVIVNLKKDKNNVSVLNFLLQINKMCNFFNSQTHGYSTQQNTNVLLYSMR